MFKKSMLSVLILVLLLSVTSVVQAQTVTSGSYTLYAPDSRTTCTPTDTVYTTGIEPDRQVKVWFLAQNMTTGNMDEIFYGEYTGNISIAYPYPAPVSGLRIFEALVEIRAADGTFITKLQAWWKITCEPTPPPPPPGNEGCTPGYWRNHGEDWPPTGYSWGDDFDAVFGVNYFTPNITLGQAIWMGGGGLNVVARHGTAALLSAAHPDVNYPYTVAQVIAYVQSGNVGALITANELGCSIP